MFSALSSRRENFEFIRVFHLQQWFINLSLPSLQWGRYYFVKKKIGTEVWLVQDHSRRLLCSLNSLMSCSSVSGTLWSVVFPVCSNCTRFLFNSWLENMTRRKRGTFFWGKGCTCVIKMRRKNCKSFYSSLEAGSQCQMETPFLCGHTWSKLNNNNKAE